MKLTWYQLLASGAEGVKWEARLLFAQKLTQYPQQQQWKGLMGWKALSCMMSAPWGLTDPWVGTSDFFFFLDVLLLKFWLGAPQLPPVDSSVPFSVYCRQDGWLVGWFLTLSLPISFSEDPETFQIPDAATTAVPDTKSCALSGHSQRENSSKVIFGLKTGNCNLLSILKLFWVLPSRKWCVTFGGSILGTGYLMLEYIKTTIECELLPPAPYFDITRNPKV